MGEYQPPQGYNSLISAATTTTSGTVEVSVAPASGANPVAVSTTDSYYEELVNNTVNAAELGGISASGFLQTGSSAPNPQTVANPVDFSDFINFNTGIKVTTENNGGGGNTLQLYDYTSGATAYIRAGSGGGFQLVNSAFTSSTFAVDNEGDINTQGTITASSGQLGSASGVWSPAAGTFDVASGTVINVAAVPSGAKMFFTQSVNGNDPESTWGTTTSSGSAWEIGGSGNTSYVYLGYAYGISDTSYGGSVATCYDGNYYADGYFQINGGYLQYVIISTTTSTDAGQTIRWGVS